MKNLKFHLYCLYIIICTLHNETSQVRKHKTWCESNNSDPEWLYLIESLIQARQYSYPVKGNNNNKNYCYNKLLFFALSIKVTIFCAINDIQYTTVMNSASSSLSGSFWLMFRLLLLSCTSLAVYYILISTVVNTFAWYHISQSLISISPEQ